MPFLIEVFNKQIEVLQGLGKNNRELQIKLQSQIFNIANTVKDFEGSVVAMRRFGAVDQKRKDEAAFTSWINENPERQKKYADVLPSLQKAYNELQKTQPQDILVQQVGGISDFFAVLGLITSAAADKEKPQAERNPNLGMAALRARAAVADIFAERMPGFERQMLAFLLRKAAELPQEQKIEAIERRFGNLKGDDRVRAEEEFARTGLESKNLSTTEAVSKLFEMTPAQLRQLNDPLIDFSAEISAVNSQIAVRTRTFNAIVGRLRPVLVRPRARLE